MQDYKRYEQALAETRYHVFDFSADLIAGSVLTGATAEIRRPDGTTAAPAASVDAVTNKVYVLVTSANLSGQTGTHHLSCRAVVDNAGALANETLEATRSLVVAY